MIWNILRQIFYCGVFHKFEPLDESSPWYQGERLLLCKHCLTEYEVYE